MLAEKPFFESPEVPAVIARFALPGTAPVPMPVPRADVASRPWRRTAAQVARATASEAEAATRRVARAVDEAHWRGGARGGGGGGGVGGARRRGGDERGAGVGA